MPRDLTLVGGSDDNHDYDAEFNAMTAGLRAAQLEGVAIGRALADSPVDDVADDEGHDRPDDDVWDEPSYTELRTAEDRRPVVPIWLQSREGLRRAVAELLGDWTYRAGFHAMRFPKYYGRIVQRAPWGVWRIASHVANWVRDKDGHEAELAVRAAAYHGKTAGPVADLHRQHHHAVYRRIFACLMLSAFLLGIGVRLAQPWGSITWAAMAVTLPAVLGWIGRDQERSIIERPMATQTRPSLTFTLVEEALEGLGIGAYNKALKRQENGEGRAVNFVTDINRERRGSSVILDLPRGVTASDVVDRNEEFAGGLRRPEATVWPERDRSATGHASRLKLYVADKELSTLPAHEWPLLKSGKVNLFEPFPIGIDRRGDRVETVLIFKAAVIGALPRYGKTVLLRLLGLAASLDPRVELHWHGLKGGSDGRPFEQTAHSYSVGSKPENIEYLLADLQRTVDDMARRYDIVESLDWEICPDSKVTDELATDRSLGLHPVVYLVDECQVGFRDKTHGGEIEALVEKLVREGPAVGIIMILSTQKPDGNSLPTDIRDNASWRMCFRVMGWQANDMVLGDGANAAGISAVKFGPEDKGVGWFAGDDDAQIIRTDFVNGPQAQRIAERARKLRERAGRLTGYAAGQDDTPDVDDRSILDHLATVWPEGQKAVWCEILADRLAAALPVYEGWTGEQVTLAVKRHGIENKGVNRKDTDGQRRNKRGLRWADIAAALDARTLDPATPANNHPDNRAVTTGQPMTARPAIQWDTDAASDLANGHDDLAEVFDPDDGGDLSDDESWDEWFDNSTEPEEQR